MNAYLLGTAALAAHRAPVIVLDDSDAPEENDSGIEVVPVVPVVHDIEAPQQMRSVPNSDGGRTVDGGGPPLATALVPMTEAAADVTEALVEAPRYLRSPIDKIDDASWTAFVLAMKTQAPGAQSASNELGMFAMKVRRLADLGFVTNLKNSRGPTGRMVWTCDWIAPMNEAAFLASPKAQYKAFAVSIKRYVAGVSDGSIELPEGGLPANMTLSGALAILHKCGPSGLKKWKGEEACFAATRDLYRGANGVF